MVDPTAPDPLSPTPEDEAVDRIVRAGPRGAIALAGLATLIVLAIWLVFYAIVFLPRTPGH